MDRIREKMRDVENRVSKVEDNLPDEFREFRAMEIKRDGIYKNVEVAIQSCYDIAAMIVKEEKLSVPGDEADIPGILAAEGVLSSEMANTLGDMKGFRNTLAHRYGIIDDEAAFENIRDGFDDFDQFLDEIEEYLD